MVYQSTNGFLAALLLGLTIVAPARAANLDAAGESDAEAAIIAALEAVRDTRKDVFDTHSSILGELPNAAECAAAQPNLRKMYSCDPATSFQFDEKAIADHLVKYKYRSFRNPPRVCECFPLGITGAYGRDVSGRHEIVVVYVEKGSPADGKLQVNDVILGTNGRLFQKDEDPRIPTGYALAESQTERFDGKLTLAVVRDGKSLTTQIELPVAPERSWTWPYDCERSEQICDQTMRFILDVEAGRLGPAGGGREFWTELFLMGTGDDEALDMVRRRYYRGLKDDYGPTDSGKSWGAGYTLVRMTEYYLLTGDSLVLPRIMHDKAILENGQTYAGGWSHSCPDAGYGEVNSTGIVAFTGLALARECGVKMDDKALPKAIRYFGRYIGGGIPYGDHQGGIRIGGGSNGKCSTAAVAYKFLYGDDEVALRFARPVCYMWATREGGHAESIFTYAWGPFGTAIAPREEFSMFHNNLLWYYELARTREGGIRFLRGGHFGYPVGQTAALSLVYILPRQQIRLAGAPRGVFGTRPPADLTQAAELWKQKRWKDMLAMLNEYLADEKAPNRDYAEKLLAAYQRQEDHVAAVIELAEKAKAAGEIPLAYERLICLEKLLGEKRPEISRILDTLPPVNLKTARNPGPKTPPIWAKQEPSSTMFTFSPDFPPTHDWEYIMPKAAETAESQKETYMAYRSADKPPEGNWFATDYKPTGWKPWRGTIRLADENDRVWIRRKFTTVANPAAYKWLMLDAEGEGEVYLNGYKLADVKEGQLYLSPGVAPVLYKDKPNILAASLSRQRGSVDIGLKAGPPVVPNLDGILDEF